MGFIQPRVELEGQPHTHTHNGNEYLVNQRTGKCWFCGQKVEEQVPEYAGQLTLGDSQLALEVRA